MVLTLNLFIFLFGLIAGSFLNCVIYRLEKRRSFLKGRSCCPKCSHQLNWYDLMPVFSYLLLRGKCRYCKKSISFQYPLIELATGFLFLAVFNPEYAVRTFYLLLVTCLLIIIFIYDLKHYIIPDKIIFPAIAIALFYNLFLLLTGDYSLARFLNMIYAGFWPALFFFLIFFLSRGKWLGFGDIKLVFFMGIFLGFPEVLAALFLAVFFGGIIGIGLIIAKIKKIKSEIPFGPFLIIGTYLALFFGQDLVNWYLNLIFL
ncbi:prepilin peptidase [Patescibacteria group bacterium]|nr:prepilin peptidase [Patescibacteria group bacterium]